MITKSVSGSILIVALVLPMSALAKDVVLDYGEFKGLVQQCHSCRKAVAAYKEKDQAQAAVIDSQRTYIESLEEGQRIQGALNTAYEAKLRDGEQLSWYERGSWLATGAVVALITRRYIPMGR